ncbi:thiamine-phosphate kinase [Aliidiomarina indica]|uniref:thiamine-phosphate kinase n=1 Tax=Aliidiomarina indica TaxID=2749147 RepID=UPI00188EE6A3|nr:thiamine-phosphate kinase [Aliidiomarina indica]
MDSTRREFALIERFFKERGVKRADVPISVGDDAAILAPPTNSHIAVTTDTMVQGVHFDEHTPISALGHKLAAVNLSDLAAMGAEPAWASLALTLPDFNEAWLDDFSRGLIDMLDYHHCSLIGGDITRGPLTLTLTVHGFVPTDRYLLRSGAQPGDRIYVSGTLGDAALALAVQQAKLSSSCSDSVRDALNDRLFRPTPRVMLGTLIRNQANSAIDLSDGLGGDLQHILSASNVGARIDLAALPRSQAFAEVVKGEQGWPYQLFGGDDYELCFTVPEGRRGAFETISRQAGVAVTAIGVIEKEAGLRYTHAGERVNFDNQSYSHF